MNPLVVKLLVVLGTVVAAFAYGWRVGAGRVEARWSAQRAADQVAQAERMQRAAEDGTKALEAVVREKDAIANDLRRARAIEVPALPVPAAVVRVHDIAAGAMPVPVPEAAGSAHGAPAPVERDSDLRAYSSAVVENYRVCREDLARFAALQEWIRAQHP